MKKILIVEDDLNAARAIAVRLNAQGYDSCATSSAAEATPVARRDKFDLFILDIGLPGKDGLSLAEDFLGFPETRSTPVLFLTGEKDFTRRLRAKTVGACGWIEKPYEPVQFLEAVAAVLGDPALSIRTRAFSSLRPVLSNQRWTGTGQSLLLIEDDKGVAAALKARLEAACYKVVTSYDGRSGLRAAAQQHPALIISDIRMPGGLGFTLLEELEGLGMPGIPVIFITASRKPGLKETGLGLGAQAVLEKPCDPTLLLRTIHRSLNRA
jgi:DNA-binding response OmpR family regulator